MSFTSSIRHSLAKSFVFKGVTGRREYWFFALFAFLLQVVLGVFDSLIAKAISMNGFNALEVVASILLLVPQLAISSRRFRDAGISAWWLLAYLLPTAAFFWALPKFIAFMDLNEYPTDAQMADAATALGPFVLSTIVVGVFMLVVSLLPTKTYAAGNRFAPVESHDVNQTELKRQGW